MRYTLDVGLDTTNDDANEALIAYGAECALEFGGNPPTTVYDALLTAILVEGFDGLWERFGPDGTLGWRVFTGYVVMPLVQLQKPPCTVTVEYGTAAGIVACGKPVAAGYTVCRDHGIEAADDGQLSAVIAERA